MFSGGKVYVDYAHTPDGLRVALTEVRSLAINGSKQTQNLGYRDGFNKSGKVIVVFGCGGDRDQVAILISQISLMRRDIIFLS